MLLSFVWCVVPLCVFHALHWSHSNAVSLFRMPSGERLISAKMIQSKLHKIFFRIEICYSNLVQEQIAMLRANGHNASAHCMRMCAVLSMYGFLFLAIHSTLCHYRCWNGIAAAAKRTQTTRRYINIFLRLIHFSNGQVLCSLSWAFCGRVSKYFFFSFSKSFFLSHQQIIILIYMIF